MRCNLYETIDIILRITAVAITILCCVRYLCKRSPHALFESSPRAAAMREDSAFAVVLAYLLGAMVLTGVAQFIFPDSDDIRPAVVVGNGAQLTGLIVCLAFASRYFDGGVMSFLFGRSERRDRLSIATFVALVVVGLGLCPLVHDATVLAVELVAEGHEFPRHPTIIALGREGVGSLVIVALWIGASVIAPVAEEAFFRGILQTLTFNMFRSRRTAIVLPSLAFGLVHFSQPQAVPALVVLGVVLGYAYERSGSLVVPVAIHAIFNLKTLIWSAVTGSPE